MAANGGANTHHPAQRPRDKAQLTPKPTLVPPPATPQTARKGRLNFLYSGLAMHRAVGTSLAIISLNSASGLARHALAAGSVGLALDWRLIAAFATIGAGGSLAGQKIGQHLPQQGLRRAFSVFLVLMAAYILWRSVPLPLTALLMDKS